MKKIGFIGLGNMGLPMALNLQKKGFEVSVSDADPKASEKAEKQGLAKKTRIDDLSTNELIIAMLPSGAHSKSVFSGKNGLIGKVTPDTILIDCSTTEPSTAKEIAAEARSKGIKFIDAPVSGGVKGAEAGTLTFIAAGNEETLKKTEPVFLAMGKKLFRAGESGAGQTAKLCNNLLLGIQMIGAAEVMELGVKNDLEPAVLKEIINNCTGACWSIGVNNPMPGAVPDSPASNGYNGGFKSKLMLKDLLLALDLAKQSNISTSLGDLTTSIYSSHVDDGNGELDFSSILKSLKR